MQHELTLSWIEQNFKKYNKEFWGGTLRKPYFEVCKTKTHLGQFNSRTWTICISNYFDRSEREFANTLIHEMIHLYIRQNKLGNQRVHHGVEFYKEANRINKFGWNIARTCSTKGVGLTDKKKIVYRVLCYADKYGRFFRMCINPNYEKRYTDYIVNTNFFKDAFFHTSTDDKEFSSYPKCTKGFRGWFIDYNTYNNIMKTEKIKKIKETSSKRKAVK